MNIEIAKKISKYIDRDIREGDGFYCSQQGYKYVSMDFDNNENDILIPNLSDMQELLRKNKIDFSFDNTNYNTLNLYGEGIHEEFPITTSIEQATCEACIWAIDNHFIKEVE